MEGNAVFRFDYEDAVNYGTDEAIFLYNLKFWLKNNKGKGKNFRDGKTWTYSSLDNYTEIFGFWKRSKIYRIINSLVKQGAIIKGNYNKYKYDKTSWYSISDYYIKPGQKSENRPVPEVKQPIPEMKKPVLFPENQIFQKRNVRRSTTETPIPDINKDKKRRYKKNIIQLSAYRPKGEQEETENRIHSLKNHPLFPEPKTGEFKMSDEEFEMTLREVGLWE